MLEYRKALRTKLTTTSTATPAATSSSAPNRTTIRFPSASYAARAQGSGFNRLNILARSLSDPDITRPSTHTNPTAVESLTPEELEASELAKDKAIVEAEWKKYIDDGIEDPDSEDTGDFDLLIYWQVSILVAFYGSSNRFN